MSYQKLLKQIARDNNITLEEVDNEIRRALQIAGYNIDPTVFIAIAVAKVEKTIYRN